MKRVVFLLMIAASMAALTGSRAAEQTPTLLPRTEAETASGKAITLPDAIVGSVDVLLVGFTKQSSTATAAWERRLLRDYSGASVPVIYRFAVLESVPRLLRRHVKRGIEKNIPKNRQDNFVLLFKMESAWKTLVRFDEPDHAYVLLLDKTGRVLWQGHSGADLEGSRALEAWIDAILPASGHARAKSN
jgi:hypothetical protein